jgi:hypothetical protein
MAVIIPCLTFVDICKHIKNAIIMRNIIIRLYNTETVQVFDFLET